MSRGKQKEGAGLGKAEPLNESVSSPTMKAQVDEAGLPTESLPNNSLIIPKSKEPVPQPHEPQPPMLSMIQKPKAAIEHKDISVVVEEPNDSEVSEHDSANMRTFSELKKQMQRPDSSKERKKKRKGSNSNSVRSGESEKKEVYESIIIDPEDLQGDGGLVSMIIPNGRKAAELSQQEQLALDMRRHRRRVLQSPHPHELSKISEVDSAAMVSSIRMMESMRRASLMAGSAKLPDRITEALSNLPTQPTITPIHLNPPEATHQQTSVPPVSPEPTHERITPQDYKYLQHEIPQIRKADPTSIN